ncbi:hypothetical protein [Streptomyces sp. NBC_00572]|uniref:hypothetical protein n=1 Tax=Streptomyces sp. NBC_00572 TaxID=2903664 RepID=UPI0022517E49|nr:hypothetical protein [Streptomyces sp. NBC_00572]MCX4985966.1 hypothetical protein [Streptomyces sp. NBC_00572]
MPSAPHETALSMATEFWCGQARSSSRGRRLVPRAATIAGAARHRRGEVIVRLQHLADGLRKLAQRLHEGVARFSLAFAPRVDAVFCIHDPSHLAGRKAGDRRQSLRARLNGRRWIIKDSVGRRSGRHSAVEQLYKGPFGMGDWTEHNGGLHDARCAIHHRLGCIPDAPGRFGFNLCVPQGHQPKNGPHFAEQSCNIRLLVVAFVRPRRLTDAPDELGGLTCRTVQRAARAAHTDLGRALGPDEPCIDTDDCRCGECGTCRHDHCGFAAAWTTKGPMS